MRVLAAVRRAEESLGELRRVTTDSGEREIILLRGLVHEIRNIVLPACLGSMDTSKALAAIKNLLDTPLLGVQSTHQTTRAKDLLQLANTLCSTWNTPLQCPRRLTGCVSVSQGAFAVVLNSLLANVRSHGASPSAVIRRRGRGLDVTVRSGARVERGAESTGWGIGLWTAAMIVEQSGGALEFGPSAEGGGVFSVRLPLRAA